jgi:hypothetical protein
MVLSLRTPSGGPVGDNDDRADPLQWLAAARWAINRLMAELK